MKSHRAPQTRILCHITDFPNSSCYPSSTELLPHEPHQPRTWNLKPSRNTLFPRISWYPVMEDTSSSRLKSVAGRQARGRLLSVANEPFIEESQVPLRIFLFSPEHARLGVVFFFFFSHPGCRRDGICVSGVLVFPPPLLRGSRLLTQRFLSFTESLSNYQLTGGRLANRQQRANSSFPSCHTKRFDYSQVLEDISGSDKRPYVALGKIGN